MTLWLDMVRCASRGAKLLGPSAGRAGEFLRSRIVEDGGLCNRIGRSDLYYTGLGLSAMAAVNEGPPAPAERERVEKYLRSFGDGAALDIVHLSCLARSWAAMEGTALPSCDAGFPKTGCGSRGPVTSVTRAAGGVARPCESSSRSVRLGIEPHARANGAGAWHSLGAAIERWRSADGGFAQDAGAARGSVYGCFLAVGAIQDCEAAVDRADAVEGCVFACRSTDGGFSNAPGESLGLAPATAGAIQVIHALGKGVPSEWGRWLIDSCFRGGAFVAHEFSPEPDLLSTAVCLHAAAMAGVALSGEQRRECAAFVTGLQGDDGGFRAAASDVMCDCEYTFYGLLAMGRLGDDSAG